MLLKRLHLSFALAILIAVSPSAHAQEPTPPTPPAQTDPAPAPAQIDPVAAPPQQPATQPPAPRPAPGKKGKVEYTGPKTVIALPATPVLDAEGRQRLDPEGKPMFNPPVLQMRDKKGHPVFDAENKPVFQTPKDLGYDEDGKKIAIVKEKPPKTTNVSITHGTFTIDGLTGKAALNYDIPDFKYIYFYVPWIGTTIVSNQQFPGSKEQKDAFNDKTLTVTVEEHTLQLYSDNRLLSKHPEPAYVLVDRDFKLPTSNPTVGYGPTLRAPYDWPGAKAGKTVAGSVLPPPLPANMRPDQMLSPCPTGQMRMPGPKPLPGQTAKIQPCVSIATAMAAHPATPTPPPAPSVTAPANPSPDAPAAAPAAPIVTTPNTAPPPDPARPPTH